MQTTGIGLYVFRPKCAQFVVSELPLILVVCALLFLSWMPWFGYGQWTFLAAAVGFAVLAFRFIYIRSKVFVFTPEQLVVKSGILSRSHEYTELYRVVDYRELRTLAQRLAGLKTVVLLSGDRLAPRIEIPGVPANEDIIDMVRTRVEANKKKRGIYEITNR